MQKTHQLKKRERQANKLLPFAENGGGGNSLHHEGILCWEKLANANKTEQGKETNLLQKKCCIWVRGVKAVWKSQRRQRKKAKLYYTIVL